MGAVSSVPKLKPVLDDKEPAVVLAVADSLFLLGDREKVYDIDYQVLIGERKSEDGFVQSQMAQLHDPKAVAMMGSRPALGSCRSEGKRTRYTRESVKDGRTPVRAAAAKELATDHDPKIDVVLATACS